MSIQVLRLASGLYCNGNLYHLCVVVDFVAVPGKYPGTHICNMEGALAGALANEREVKSARNAQKRGLNSAVRSFYRLGGMRLIEALNLEDFSRACLLIYLPRVSS